MKLINTNSRIRPSIPLHWTQSDVVHNRTILKSDYDVLAECIPFAWRTYLPQARFPRWLEVKSYWAKLFDVLMWYCSYCCWEHPHYHRHHHWTLDCCPEHRSHLQLLMANIKHLWGITEDASYFISHEYTRKSGQFVRYQCKSQLKGQDGFTMSKNSSKPKRP